MPAINYRSGAGVFSQSGGKAKGTGWVDPDITGSPFRMFSDKSGCVYVPKNTWYNFAKLHPNGSSAKGWISPFSASNLVYDANYYDDLSFLVAGTFIIGGTSGLVKLLPDGTRDTSFNNGGAGLVGSPGRPKIIRLSTGKIIIFGVLSGIALYNGNPFYISCRVNSNGSYDASYSVDFASYVYSIQETCTILTGSDDFIIGGDFLFSKSGNTYQRLAKISSNGNINTSFNQNAVLNGCVYGNGFYNSGKIVVAGAFTSIAGAAKNYIAGLNADGSIDSGFTVGTGFNGVAYDLKIRSDGKIVVAGAFTSYNGTPASRVAILNADGSIDTSFDSCIDDGVVSHIVLSYDGLILCAGSFTSANGVSRRKLLCLHPDGSLLL